MPNRLAAEKSPYLRQHAGNPVDWQPWGDEALTQARDEQKPIFLSIGYSTCHWCHVMAHESFESPEIAAALNRDFVPVKVDREERPDLDRVYMAYVQHTTGHGGWPMSVWLTPAGKPFYGGTYFPPDDRPGRPGFKSVLAAIARHWAEQREKILSGADEIVRALQRYAAEGPAHEMRPEDTPGPRPEAAPEVPALAAGEAFEKGFQYFYETYDPRWGGFGGAPKFPRASVIDFLFRVAALQGMPSDSGQEAVQMAAHTLQRMAEGGLHDHLGGGFHRYSVDEQWHVPHFEKMLYDQAQIAHNFLEARQTTGIEVYAWVARGIFDYVRRDLTGPQGAFYSAEDADSAAPDEQAGRVAECRPSAPVVLAAPSSAAHRGSSGGFALPAGKAPAEGAFYVWTKTELDAVLGTDTAFFCAHYGVQPGGNVAHDPQGEFCGKNVLRQQRPLAQTAEESGLTLEVAVKKLLAGQEKLRTLRAKRPRPSLDDKIITAWNGLMISALARGWQVLGDAPPPARPDRGEGAAAPNYLQTATRAAEFIERELYDATTGTLFRCWRDGRSDIAGFAEDYACLIQGLLDLYEAGFDIRWLQWAERLQGKMDELFWDADRGGYFNSRAGDPSVIVRLKEDQDGAEPAPSSVAALNLLRLDWMLGTRGARDRALKTIEAFRGHWSRAPQALPRMLCAVELALAPPRTVVLAGDPSAEDFRGLAAVVHKGFGPRRALLGADGGAGQQWLAARRPYLGEMKSRAGRAVAFVCEEYTCRAPVDSPDALRAVLAG